MNKINRFNIKESIMGDPINPNAPVDPSFIKSGMDFASNAAHKLASYMPFTATPTPPSMMDNIISSGKKYGGEALDFVNAHPSVRDVGLGVGGALLASKLISSVYEKHKWKTQGCAAIDDPVKKAQCQVYVNNTVLGDLRAQMPHCDSPECIDSLGTTINGLTNNWVR